jgi:Skp family chaperone for outer membrane proteins
VTQPALSPSFFVGVAAAIGLSLAAVPGAAVAQTATQAAPAPAQQQVPLVIGVLDAEAIFINSSAGKSIKSQADAQLKALQDNTQKQGDALMVKAQQLEAKRTANPPISAADYAAQRKALAAQDDKIRGDFDKNKQALDQRVAKARDVLSNTARKIMQDIATARGLTLILNRSSLNMFPPQWNITDEVMQRLNKTLPSVKL